MRRQSFIAPVYVCVAPIQCVCGFSTMDNIALLNLEGMGMKGFPGIAARLFGALHAVGISVILISQVSLHRELSLCCTYVN